jgi:hypothetical protein
LSHWGIILISFSTLLLRLKEQSVEVSNNNPFTEGLKNPKLPVVLCAVFHTAFQKIKAEGRGGAGGV